VAESPIDLWAVFSKRGSDAQASDAALEFTRGASETVAVHIDHFGHLDEIGEGLRHHLPHGLSPVDLHRRFREPGCSMIAVFKTASALWT
jgi:hypothetical protein